MNYILAMDTETGGLDPNNSDILTIYIGVFDETLQLLEELDLKLKPDNRLPLATVVALNVNKINLTEHLNNPDTVTYSEAKNRILQLIKKYLKKRGRYSNLRPLGQNVYFDLSFIWQHLIPRAEWDALVHYGVRDTKLCVDFLKDCGFFPKELGNLSSLVEYFGLPKLTAHSAKEDTIMTVNVYRKLLEFMASKKDNGSQQDLISLLESE
jgi:oligoribonuclease (3'-5' exoribonuclease)